MTINIVVPSLGESVTEATVAKWYKKVGEKVQIDQILLELETDKITLEINAPESGVLTEIKFDEGDIVQVGDNLGLIQKEEITAIQQISENNNVSKTAESQEEFQNNQRQQNEGQIFSPAAQKIASEHNIKSVSNATGKDGRVTKQDVLSSVSANNSDSQSILEERVKMSRLRKTIARRLKDSQNTAAILSTFNEIDMSAAIRCRKNYQDTFKNKHGIKLGFMSFFVKAATIVLKEIPNVNAEIDNDYLIYKNYYNIGVAVGTDQGLVVPVIKNTDKLSYADIENNIVQLGKKARDGNLTMGNMQGGTFSITNGGIYGSLLSTPIINPPQSAILGMHNIIQRPIAVSNEIMIRPMMYVALSYDHRIIDGSEAVTFLRRVKELVENPEKILFEL